MPEGFELVSAVCRRRERGRLQDGVVGLQVRRWPVGREVVPELHGGHDNADPEGHRADDDDETPDVAEDAEVTLAVVEPVDGESAGHNRRPVRTGGRRTT